MQHHAAVAHRPFRSGRRLLSYESVFHAQTVVGKRLVIEDMAKPLVKGGAILTIAHFQDTTFKVSPKLTPTSCCRIFTTQFCRSRPLKSAIHSSLFGSFCPRTMGATTR